MWLLIPILVYFLIYFIVRHIYSHWKRNGYPTERANLNWSFLKKVYKREFDHVDAVNDAYSSGGHLPFLGIYFLFQPMLLIRDIPLSQSILEHTHNCFNNARWEYMHGYRKVNILEKLAPVFAVSRVEGMLRNIDKFADYMVNHLNTITQTATTNEGPNVDMQHIIKICSANIMGSLIYGVDLNLYKQTDSMFTVYKESQSNRFTFSYTLSHFPKKSVLTYKLRDLIRASVERRETEGYIRKDILQLLVKYRNGNNIGSGPKSNWHIENSFVQERLMSIETLSKIAEKFMDTSFNNLSSTTIMTLHEVLQQPHILKNILDEIDANATPLQSNVLTFEILNSLKYLDACIQETQRLYPSVPIIERICNKHFIIPQSRYVISVGNKVIIPVMALQRDERYFPESLKYKPERFMCAENPADNTINSILEKNAYFALTFSKTVVKIVLLKLLTNFHMEIASNMNYKICHNPVPFVKARNGFCIKVSNRPANDSAFKSE